MQKAERAQLSLPVVGPPPENGAPLLERNQVEYVEMTVRSILNWVDGRHMSDVFSINPYRGCEFGCSYCYARYTHEFLDLPDWEAFERKVFVKTDAARALRRDLATSRDVRRHGISIGSATDPYQPAEAKFRVTRSILQALLPHRGIPLSLVTKSGLIAQDAELIAELSRRHDVKIFFSCITTDRTLLRAIERRSPMAHVRFGAMRTLVDLGVHCEVLMMPILPGITDGEENLRGVMRAAKEAGASKVHGGALWLTDASKRRFLPWLEEQFPELHRRYVEAFGTTGMYTPEQYRKALKERLARLRSEEGFDDQSEVAMAH
jgi:DNA repair photolyase